VKLLEDDVVKNCKEQGASVLCWTVTSFEVEKSADGINFELVGEVLGAGLSSLTNYYEMTDEHPYPGTSYYRLKQVDYDAKETYFELVAVRFEQMAFQSFEIFPNPTHGQPIVINVHGLHANQECLVIARDVMGREFFSKVILVNVEGDAHLVIDPNESLAPGTYIITGASESSMFSKKLIVE